MEFSELTKILRLDRIIERSPSPQQEKIKHNKRVTFKLTDETLGTNSQASKHIHLSSRHINLDNEIDSSKCLQTSPDVDSPKATVLAEDLVKQEEIVQESTTKTTKKIKSTKTAKTVPKKVQSEKNDDKYNLPLVVHSAIQCLTHLRAVKEEIGGMALKDDEITLKLSKRTRHTTAYYEQYTSLAKIITILSREAFLCSHRLSQTAIGLHYIEDILRIPKVVEMYNFAEDGPITIPAMSFNNETVVKIGACLDHASELYDKFKVKGRGQMKKVLELMMLALDYLQMTTVGALDIFQLLLYGGEQEKRNLHVFFSSMRSVQRVEMLVELQDLRTCIDDIVMFVERLSWGAYTIFCLSCGVDVAAEDDSLQNPFEDFSIELTPSRYFKPQDDPDNYDYDAFVTIDTVKIDSKKSRAREMEEDQKSCKTKEMDEVQSFVSQKSVIWTLDDIQKALAPTKSGAKEMDEIRKSFASKKTVNKEMDEIRKSFVSKKTVNKEIDGIQKSFVSKKTVNKKMDGIQKAFVSKKTVNKEMHEIQKACASKKSGAKEVDGGQKSKRATMQSMK